MQLKRPKFLSDIAQGPVQSPVQPRVKFPSTTFGNKKDHFIQIGIGTTNGWNVLYGKMQHFLLQLHDLLIHLLILDFGIENIQLVSQECY